MPRSRHDDDDDDDDDDRPRRKSRRDRDDDDEDDEDEDDRPRRKRSRSIADDEDDRPRKRTKVNRSRKSSGGGGGAMVLVLLLVGGAVVLLAGGGVAVWLLFFNDTPQRAFDDVKDAILKKDYGRLYDRMDKRAQQDMEKQAELMMQFDKSLAVHNGKKGKELFVAVSKEMDNKTGGLGANFNEKMREDIRNTTVEKVEVNGDTATLTLKAGNGRTETGKMVKQDGRWRITKK